MFKNVILGAFGFVWLYKRQLAMALMYPFALYIALELAETFVEDSVGGWMLFLVGILAQTLFAVTTHRMILLGPAAVPKWGILRWSLRETVFALHIIGLNILVLLLVAPLVYGLNLISEPSGVVAVPVAISMIIAAFWLIGRLSLVFPGIAIDKGVMFIESWRLTKNYQVLMFCVVAVFPFLLLVPMLLIATIPAILFENDLMAAFISGFFQTLATVFIVAALSVAYKIITREVYGR